MVTIEKEEWQYRDLSAELSISISEISESLNRSHLAGLVDERRRKVHRQSLMEFIEYGLHYVFPQAPGSMVTGIPTAHSHPYYKKLFPGAEMQYAWPAPDGNIRGLAIGPLHHGIINAVGHDKILYLLLASIDIIRVGRARECKEAKRQLKQIIL